MPLLTRPVLKTDPGTTDGEPIVRWCANLALLAAAALGCSEPAPPIERPPAAPPSASAAAPACATVGEPDVDAMRQALLDRSFAELDRDLRVFQEAFEASQACEPRAWNAFGAFLDAPTGGDRAQFARRLDEWVAAQPQSFVPLAARGTFALGEAYRFRGSGKVHYRKVEGEMWRGMHEAHDRAIADLDAVRHLHPRHVFAHTSLMQIHRTGAEGWPSSGGWPRRR